MIDPSEAPADVSYHPRRHAAVRTDEYLYAQLIPYIGNKRKLLPLIAHGIQRTGLADGTFVDLFSGSSVVSRLAKTLGFRVAANDWEPYAYEIARGTVALNRVPTFAALGGGERVFDELNALTPQYGYVAEHLCPTDDERPDPSRERMFFTRANGERIDAIRERIATWDADGRLSPDERSFLLSALLYSVSYVSNTSGVFKGFHDGWGGRTRTALYRIRSALRMRPPLVFDNHRDNPTWREDAQTLAGELGRRLGRRADVVYLDPPYNQHPYGSNYHVLNTVALWDKPVVSPRIQVNGKARDKSAIRKDWRTERRSPYNSARAALPAFQALVGALDARWILTSYSTDGNIPVADLLQALAARGDACLFTRRYKRYRVSTPRMSRRPHTIEFLAVVDTEGQPSTSRVEELVDQIAGQEESLDRLKVMKLKSGLFEF
ncbi:MAG: DNA adenine methylase [Chloroflexota bacterium]